MYDDFKEDIQNINKKNFRINGNLVLLFITILCVVMFIFIMIKSYHISKHKTNIDNIEIIKSTNTNIKTKINENEKNITVSDNIYSVIDNVNEQQTNVSIMENKNIESDELNNKITALLDNTDNEKTIDNLIDEVLTTEQIKEVKVNQNSNNAVINANNIKKVSPSEIINNSKQYDLFKIQLVSLKTKESTKVYIDNLYKSMPELFENLKSYVEEIDLNEKGKYYRVQFGDFVNRSEAEQFCKNYINSSNNKLVNCLIIKK